MINITRRRFVLYMLWPVFLVAIVAAALPVWFPQMGYSLVVSDPLQKADAITVLGGGDPQRIKVAVSLYNEKWAPVIITLGDMVPDYMIEKKGVPPENVFALIKGASTFEEAEAVREYAQNKKFSRIIVVTSIYHTRRAGAVYRKVLKDAGVEVVMRPASGGMFKTDKWWTREDDLVFVNSEWVKMLLYKLKGRI
jgi:uncharacterized SAM-binding protein YcdF (DUF218 family)